MQLLFFLSRSPAGEECHRAPWHPAVYQAVEDEPNNEDRTYAGCGIDLTSRNLTGIMTLNPRG